MCEIFGCEYCAKVERKNSEELEKAVGRIVFGKGNFEEWRKGQEEDLSIFFILRSKESGDRPPRTEIPSEDIFAQIYWSY